jgi:methyl-accepting chemotaxis protein
MRILNRMLIAFGCVAGVGIVQNAGTLISVETLTGKIDHATTNPLKQVDAARSVWEAFGQANAELAGTLEGIRQRASADAIARFNGHVATMAAELARLRSAQPSPQMLTEADKAQQLIEQWRRGALTLLGEKPATAIPAPHVMEKQQAGIRASLQGLAELARKDAEATKAEIGAHVAWTKRLMIAFAVLGGILGIGAAVAAAVSLTRPLVRLQTRMHDLMKGDVESPVLDRDRKDEIGRIAETVEFVKATLVERNRLQEEAAVAARAAEESRRQAEEKAIERERTLVLESIGAGLAKLAAKDLGYRMSDNIPEAYRKLQADFNAALEELEKAVQGVRACTQLMQSGTAEIASASGDLSRRTEQQAARLEETSAALDKITATVRKAAEGATHAREVVANAKEDAEKGGEVVRKTVEAMAGIEKSSQQIGQIIGVIDEIAFQTNLLALNAGVEAARAGDAGRGFAVVASEVRALAQRSAEAAKEIKGLITASTTQVGHGVGLVAETGKALERMVGKVAEINQVVLEISSGAEGQATELREINAAVGELDKGTQQNAAMAEEATAVSRTLAEQSEELTSLIGEFRVGKPTELKPVRRAATARAEQARRPTAQSVVRPQLKTLAGRNGSALPKSDPAADEQGWQDF